MNLLIIKVTEEYEDFIKHLKNATINNSKCYYNTYGKNRDSYNEIYDKLDSKIDPLNTIFIIHNNNVAKQAYICKSQRIESTSNIMCTDITIIDNKEEIVQKFIEDILLDLEEHFKPGVYIDLKPIPREKYLSLIYLTSQPYKPSENSIQEQRKINKYKKLECKEGLHPLAQRNEYCIRPFEIQDNGSNRSQFQRDRERIVHTKAYRRLVDKAQIFTSNKGDHYRTRMTHTLEVSQIARGIAQRLKLNLDLTEAIALGHDIGHTPFGHQGERTLNDILDGTIDIIPNAKDLNIGGFNHNYQSIRVVNYLEEKYIEHEGINLSYQTLEGIIKHTKCKKDKFEIDKFLIYGDKEYLYLSNIDDEQKNRFSVTLEGQVVEIADEIAQRGHDLDDAFASGLLNLESFKDACEFDEMSYIKEIITDTIKKISSYKNKNRVIIDEADLIRAMIVPNILNFLINDVVSSTNTNINNYDYKFFNENKILDKKLVTFSKSKDRDEFVINDYLEDIISKNVINSFEVSRFDAKAGYIIESLFKTYYNNPKLLPNNVLSRLRKEFSKIPYTFIDLRLNSPKNVSKEIYEIINYTTDQANSTELKEEYESKRIILARCITDHISGMTDNYALNELSKLYESS